MRAPYKKDLALVKVRNLKHLIKLCIKIDAEDQNLKKKEQETSKSVNVIYPQHRTESEMCERIQDLTLVDSIQVTGDQAIHTMTPNRSNMMRLISNQPVNRNTNQIMYRVPYQANTVRAICWNCNRAGHLWNICPEQKTVFCHLCGNPGRTANTCENHVGFNQMNKSSVPSRLMNSRSQSQPNLAFAHNNQTMFTRPLSQTGNRSTLNLNHPGPVLNRFAKPIDNFQRQRGQSTNNLQVLELCEPESGLQYVAYPVHQLDYHDFSAHVTNTQQENDDKNNLFVPSNQKN